MSQIATLPLKNKAGTAVNFSPVTSQKGDTPAEWAYKPTGSVFLGTQRATQVVRRNPNGVLKVTSKITVPVIATDAANISTLAGQLIANINLSIPADINPAVVEDFVAYVSSYTSSSAFVAAGEAGEIPY